LRLNEHMEEDGPLVFHHALQAGPGGDRVEAEGLAL
jgi:hypothetical protein